MICQNYFPTCTVLGHLISKVLLCTKHKCQKWLNYLLQVFTWSDAYFVWHMYFSNHFLHGSIIFFQFIKLILFFCKLKNIPPHWLFHMAFVFHKKWFSKCCLGHLFLWGKLSRNQNNRSSVTPTHAWPLPAKHLDLSKQSIFHISVLVFEKRFDFFFIPFLAQNKNFIL